MKRRVALLVTLLALTLGGLSALAASSMDNFRDIRSYDGRFADVPADSWYYDYVAALYRMGLTEGRSSVRYGADEPVTVEEVIVFAARIRSVYSTGSPEAGPSAYPEVSRWSDPYVDYLQGLGALGTQFDPLLTQSATRAQAAGILANALPSGVLPQINGDAVTQGYATGRYITDVTAYTAYQQEILSLYKWGVVEGMDAQGSYYPSQTIRRRELAAMLVRLVDENARITISWSSGESHSAAGTTMADLVEGGTVFHRSHELDDLEAIDENIRWMLSHSTNTISLSFGPGVITSSSATQVMDQYLLTMRQNYIEQGYNAISCSFRVSTGAVTLTFNSSVFSDATLSAARENTMAAAIRVHDQLWQEGRLKASMTEKEKARVYYTWLAENCIYDSSAGSSSPSHTAYGLFFYGRAVCDGYTAAYNLLLKLEGISCTAYSLEDHIWTVATLDGKAVHSDATWGDQGTYVAYQYFDMTESKALSRF